MQPTAKTSVIAFYFDQSASKEAIKRNRTIERKDLEIAYAS